MAVESASRGEWLQYSTQGRTSSRRRSRRQAREIAFVSVSTVGTSSVRPGFPSAGSWDAWQTVRRSGLVLQLGRRIMGIVMERDGATGDATADVLGAGGSRLERHSSPDLREGP